MHSFVSFSDYVWRALTEQPCSVRDSIWLVLIYISTGRRICRSLQQAADLSVGQQSSFTILCVFERRRTNLSNVASLSEPALQRIPGRMDAAHPIHISFDDIIPPHAPKAREAVPDGSRTISNPLLVSNGPVSTFQAIKPLVEGQPLVDRGYPCDFGERLREVFPSHPVAGDLELFARCFFAVVKGVSNPPSQIIESNHGDVAVANW